MRNKQKRKRRTKKKRVLKKKFRYLFMFLAMLITINTISLSLNKGEVEGTSEEFADIHVETKSELTSNEINKLTQISKEHPAANLILNNPESYPTELIKLACSNEETVEFVSNYTPPKKSLFKKRISVRSDYTRGEIPLFIQWDERWGYEKYGSEYIAINGCAPTCLSMVAVGLTNNTKINPKVVADYSYKHGYLQDRVGTKWSFLNEGANHFGLQSMGVPIDRANIIETLKSNKPIIASMGPGQFTLSGHFIVLNGIDSNNKIKVLDPNSKQRSAITWDIDVFLREAKSMWSFSAI